MIPVLDELVLRTRIIPPTGLAPTADGQVMGAIPTDMKGAITDRLVNGHGIENECFGLFGPAKCV